MSYVDYARYDEATGMILALGRSIDTYHQFLAREGQPLLLIPDVADVDSDVQYVVAGEVVDRPTLDLTVSKTTIVADGVDEAVISGIPAGALGKVSGAPTVVVNDGEIRITSDVVAEIIVIVQVVPYQDWTTTITATAP